MKHPHLQRDHKEEVVSAQQGPTVATRVKSNGPVSASGVDPSLPGSSELRLVPRQHEVTLHGDFYVPKGPRRGDWPNPLGSAWITQSSAEGRDEVD